MQYVICYDVSDDDRRERLARTLLDYGRRVQESVFVANLDDDLAERMRERVGPLIRPEMDRLHMFVLCQGCAGRTITIGDEAEVPRDEEFYII